MEPTSTILIVDDDREIRELLAAYLEKNGMRATAVAGGRQMRAVLAAKLEATDRRATDIETREQAAQARAAIMEQQAQALQQATTLAQQMGDELKAVNQLLVNKDKENAIRAYEAITKGEVGQSQIVKNLAEAQAKGDSAAVAAFQAQLSAVAQLGKSLEATINAADNNAGNGGGMAGQSGDALAPGAAGLGAG